MTLVRVSVLKQADSRLSRSDPILTYLCSKTLLCYGVQFNL